MKVDLPMRAASAPTVCETAQQKRTTENSEAQMQTLQEAQALGVTVKNHPPQPHPQVRISLKLG